MTNKVERVWDFWPCGKFSRGRQFCNDRKKPGLLYLWLFNRSTYAGHVVDAGGPGLAPDEPDGRQGDADEDQECHHQANQEAQVLFHHRLSCTRNRRNDSHWSAYSGPIRRLGPVPSQTQLDKKQMEWFSLVGVQSGQSGGSGPVPSQIQLHKKQKEWFSLVGVKWANQEAQVLFHHWLSCTRNRRNDSHWSAYWGQSGGSGPVPLQAQLRKKQKDDSRWLTYSGPIWRLRSWAITGLAAQETGWMILIGRRTVGNHESQLFH